MSATTLIISPTGAGCSFAADVYAHLEHEKVADIGNLSASGFPIGDVRAALAQYPNVAMSGDRVPDIMTRLAEGGELDGISLFIVVASPATVEQALAIISALHSAGISRRRILSFVNVPTWSSGWTFSGYVAIENRLRLAGAQVTSVLLPSSDIADAAQRTSLALDVSMIRAGGCAGSEYSPMLGTDAQPLPATDMVSAWAAEAADPDIVSRLDPAAQRELAELSRMAMDVMERAVTEDLEQEVAK